MRYLLEIEEAQKSFGAVRALRGVDLHLKQGEILALLGDNGAGKSTLIKCISGAHSLDGGRIKIDGEVVTLRSPAAARALGIETVYQDLALFDNLSAAQNFYAGREMLRPKFLRRLGILRDSRMLDETKAALRRLEVGVSDFDASLSVMSGGQRQAIAVARAVAFASRIVILDEPTAALGVRESRNVINLVRRLPAHGVSVILISHNLEEVMQLADRAVVLRRGVLVGEAIPTADSHAQIVSMIVGGDRTSVTE